MKKILMLATGIVITVIIVFICISNKSINETQIQETLPITILPTSWHNPEIGQKEPSYPKTITVSLSKHLVGKVAAYGVSFIVLLAPTSWTGDGTIGTDGTGYATIHPVNNRDKASIVYGITTPIYDVADVGTLYFPSITNMVKKDLPAFSSSDPIQGLQLQRDTTNTTFFSKPSKPNGLLDYGFVYLNLNNNTINSPFKIIEVNIPSSQKEIGDLSIQYFKEHYANKTEF